MTTDWFQAMDDLGTKAVPTPGTEAPTMGHGAKVVSIMCELLAPLVHGSFGQSAGNATLIRRLPIVSLPGMPRVPVVSGNSLRGALRRLVFRDLFGRACIGPGVLPGRQWDRLYAALANGGHLEGSEQTYKPDAVKALRAALPPLSMFGAALYSWMLPGRMSVGILWPVCQETVAARLCQPGTAPLVMAEGLVEEGSHCRHVDRTEQDPETSGVTPMPTTVETLSTGAVLVSQIAFASNSRPAERGAVLHGIALLRSLGGKAGIGLGNVRVTTTGADSTDLDAYRIWAEVPGIDVVLRELAVALEGAKAGKDKNRKRPAIVAEAISTSDEAVEGTVEPTP